VGILFNRNRLTSGDKHKTDILTTDFSQKKLYGTGIETQHKIVYV